MADRDFAIESEGLNVLPGLFDVLGIRVQTVNEVGSVCSKPTGEPAVTASEMHNQPSPDARFREDLHSVVRVRGSRENETNEKRREA